MARTCERTAHRRRGQAEPLRDRDAFGHSRLRQLSARPRPHQCRTGRDGRYLRRMDRPAHRHPPAPYRRSGRAHLRSRRCRPRGRRSPMPASMPQSIDLIVLGDLDAGQHLSGDRRHRAGRRSASLTARPSTCRRSVRASSSRWRPPTACCATGGFKRALVIGAETFSRILDWTDRTTCVLFGDGAGAVVLEAQEQPGDAAGSRHPDHASALRRPPQEQALCRWRAVLDRDGRPSAHGGPRGVQACGRP